MFPSTPNAIQPLGHPGVPADCFCWTLASDDKLQWGCAEASGTLFCLIIGFKEGFSFGTADFSSHIYADGFIYSR